MPIARSTARFAAALMAAGAITVLSAGATLAHPESEGAHPGGCVVTAEPGSIAAGGQFTVAGNFGNASIWVLPGADATVPEDAEPSATTPATGSSFSITFTHTGAPGELTIFAAIEGSECGDTDSIMVTAATLPNTAVDARTGATVAITGVLLLGTAGALGRRHLLRR